MTATIKAIGRNDLRRSKTKELRNQGSIPAVVYGKKTPPTTVAVDSMELLKTVKSEGKNAVFSLDIDGGNPVSVMLYDVQEDPMKNEIIHADFYQVDMSSVVDVEVAIHIEGQDKIPKDGVVQQPTHHLQVRAKPNDIPDYITVDVSELEIGDVIEVRDIKGKHNYEILENDETTIVTILPPQNVMEDELATEETTESEENSNNDGEKEE